MITAHTINSTGSYDKAETLEGANTLVVQAPTARKGQTMVYIALENVSGTAVARLSFDMIDPDINDGKPFRMCRLEGANVVAAELELSAPGTYRVPVPIGANESHVVVNAELVDADAATDKLEFWVTTDAYQPVSGLLM